MKLATAEGDETLPGATVTAPYFTTVRDALDRWRARRHRSASRLRAGRAIDRPSVRARGVAMLRTFSTASVRTR